MHTRVHLPTAVAPLALERLHSLVENRTVYRLEGFELNVFETHRAAHRVPLRLDGLALTTMLRGKKVMHLPGRPAFDYLPGESVVVDKDELMEIDFPEACLCQPTQCLAVAIAPDTIRHTVDMLNERYPKAEPHQPWAIAGPEHAHLTNTPELTDTLGRLVAVSRTSDVNKDVLAGFTLQELLVRLMHLGARRRLLRLAVQLLRPACRRPRPAAATRPRREGDRTRLRARAAHRIARLGVVARHHPAGTVRERHVRRPARLVESQAAQRLQGDLRALRQRKALGPAG